MRTRKMSKMMAAILSAAMVMSMSMTAFATEGAGTDTTPTTGSKAEVEAPIYSYDLTDVVVPTDFKVAFNPDGLTVTTGTDTTSTDQIISKNYGIINKSTKDKIVSVALTVEDKNDQITFVSSKDDVDNAEKGEYAIYLAAIPADATEVQVGGAPANKDTTVAALADVTMTKADTAAVALNAGVNSIAFKLDKATYKYADGENITLGTTNDNNVADLFVVDTLAEDGKGITAFTFGGVMNADADWTKLGSAVKITAVYSNETAEGGESPVTGTGALYVSPAPKFSTGSAVGTISYTKGTGDDALKSITKIEMDYNGNLYDGYNALAGTWETATDVNGAITLSTVYVGNYASLYPSDSVRKATVTYLTEKDETKTAEVNVKIR